MRSDSGAKTITARRPTFLSPAIAAPTFLTLVLSAVISTAQTASQITPRTFTPSAENQPSTGLTISASQVEQAPAGAASLFVRLAHVELQGG